MRGMLPGNSSTCLPRYLGPLGEVRDIDVYIPFRTLDHLSIYEFSSLCQMKNERGAADQLKVVVKYSRMVYREPSNWGRAQHHARLDWAL